MIQNARGEREAAADNLLAIVKADREWKDDGARAQLLQFFEAWGPTDEATLTARRKAVLAAVLVRPAASGLLSFAPARQILAGCRVDPRQDGSWYRRETFPTARSPTCPIGAGLSADGRAAPAGRPHAAQHLRAALSGDGRRRHLASRLIGMVQPRLDGAKRADGEPELCEVGCLGRLTSLHRDRRRALSGRAAGRLPLPRRRGDRGAQRLSPVPHPPFAADLDEARAPTRSTVRRS
jgi:hypothetical protein